VLRLEKQDAAREREDQIPRCAVCGYRGHDPVREVVHGSDGPHAVIATALYQLLPQRRKKVLAFADGRLDAAFFAWYLDRSYQDILYRNLILESARRLRQYSQEGLSLSDLVEELKNQIQSRGISDPQASDLSVRRQAWIAVCREFLTDEKRLSLEGVGLGRWTISWPEWFRVPDLLLEEPWNLTEAEAMDLLYFLIDSMRNQGAIELQHSEPFASVSWSDLQLQKPQTRVRVGRPRTQSGVRSWDGPQGVRAKFLKRLLVQKGLSEDEAEHLAIQTLRQIWEAFDRYDHHAPFEASRLLLKAGDARRLNSAWWRFQALKKNDRVFQCDTCGRLQAVPLGGLCARIGCPGKLKEVAVVDLEPNHYRYLYETDLPGRLRVEEHTAQLAREKAREFQAEFKEGRIHVLSCSTTFELGVDLGDLDTVFLRNVPPETFNYVQRVGRAGRRPGSPGIAITYCRRSPHDLYHFTEPSRMLRGLTKPPVLRLQNEKILLRHITAVAISKFFRAYPDRFGNVELFFGDLENPSAVADFRAFLRQNQAEIERSLVEIIPVNMHEKLGLLRGEWIDYISLQYSGGEESRFAQAEAELTSDYCSVKKLERECRDKGKYKMAEWARRRAKTIAEEDILSYLSRKAVIPKYGFPVDVVELDTQSNSHDTQSVQLQRDLNIAIAEFAPGSQLVANKKLLTSYGLKIVAERAWERRFYRRCTDHNRFDTWNPGDEPPVDRCCGKMTATRQYVIPRFGFVTSVAKPREPKGRPVRLFGTRPFFIGFSGKEQSTVEIPERTPLLRVSKACPGKMGVICEGRRGQGFFICQSCGAGFSERKQPHETPQGRHCSGTLAQLTLGHEFITDVLRIQFLNGPAEDVDPLWFTYSLAYALVGGAAEVLEVPPADLNTTVAHGSGRVLPIVLYDNVPGGAGLVACLEEEYVIFASLKAAHDRVDGRCGCGEDESCYGCLRSYTNQFAHHKIQRGPVRRFLAEIISQWKEASPN